MTPLVNPSTPDIMNGTVKTKQIKTNSSDLRHLIIEIPPQVEKKYFPKKVA